MKKNLKKLKKFWKFFEKIPNKFKKSGKIN